MPTTATDRQDPALPSGSSGTGRRWTRFLTGTLLILFFAFVVVPGLQRLGPVREVRDAIHRRGIDASALFYTETEVSSEAETAIRNAMTYSPRRENE